MRSKVFATVLLMIVLSPHVFTQTTAFNFQGRLNDGTNPANGHYDLQFKLFSSVTGGIPIAPSVDRPNMVLVNGVFSTTLDFGTSVFSGGDRFIEISLRPNGSPNAFVVLGARQQILTVPYSIRAVNATNAQTAQIASDSTSLGGVDASNYARLNFLNSGDFRSSGNAGFGTVAPSTRLTLSGGPSWTSNGWTASINMQNASALGWEPNASGQRFGIGQSDGGLYFFRTYAGFGQTIPPANTDLQIADNGSLTQPVDRNGLVKAMVAVTADGSLSRCYNGVTGSTQCTGFSAKMTPSYCEVQIPISFSNRFWLVNPDTSFVLSSNTDVFSASVGISNAPNSLRVFLWKNGTPTPLPFHLFVF